MKRCVNVTGCFISALLAVVLCTGCSPAARPLQVNPATQPAIIINYQIPLQTLPVAFTFFLSDHAAAAWQTIGDKTLTLVPETDFHIVWGREIRNGVLVDRSCPYKATGTLTIDKSGVLVDLEIIPG